MNVSLSTPPRSSLSLFTPHQIKEGVVVADATVEVPKGTCMNLLVGNHNPYPVRLKKGAVLGSLE